MATPIVALGRASLRARRATPTQHHAATVPQVVHGLSLTDPRCAEVLAALPGVAGVTAEPELTQLHAGAHNALMLALMYLSRGDLAAAQRKASQAMASMQQLQGVAHG